MNNEEVEVNKIYEILNDDDVFRLDNGDTFTVQKFKLLVIKEYDKMHNTYAQIEVTKTSLYKFIVPIKINKETRICAGDLTWKSPQKGINCQIIKTSAKGWQKGKLKIEVNASIDMYESYQQGKTQAWVSFCSDELPEPVSPLDEIRQSEEYKNL